MLLGCKTTKTKRKNPSTNTCTEIFRFTCVYVLYTYLIYVSITVFMRVPGCTEATSGRLRRQVFIFKDVPSYGVLPTVGFSLEPSAFRPSPPWHSPGRNSNFQFHSNIVRFMWDRMYDCAMCKLSMSVCFLQPGHSTLPSFSFCSLSDSQVHKPRSTLKYTI